MVTVRKRIQYSSNFGKNIIQYELGDSVPNLTIFTIYILRPVSTLENRHWIGPDLKLRMGSRYQFSVPVIEPVIL